MTDNWTTPVPLGADNGRIAAGARLHFVSGVSGSGTLHHRSSDNAGSNWSQPVPIAGAGLAPLYRTFAADGLRLDLVTIESGGHLYYRRSTDGGSVWTSPLQLSVTELEKPHRVSIAVRDDFVHVVNSREFNAGSDRRVFYWRSTDGGDSFASAVILDSHADGPTNPAVATSSSVVHVVYARWSEGQAYYTRSVDNGTSWEAPVRLSDPADGSAFRARVAATDGRVVVSWQQDIPTDPLTQRIGIRRSADEGASWQPRGFATPARRFNHQVMLMQPGGMVHITSIEGTPRGAGTTAQYFRSADYGATWSTPQTIATQSEVGASQPFEMTAGNQFVHVVLGPTPLYTRRAINP